MPPRPDARLRVFQDIYGFCYNLTVSVNPMTAATLFTNILDKNTDIIYSPQTCHFSGVPISYLKNEPSEQPRLTGL